MRSEPPLLTISSIFRDSTSYIDTYFRQVDALEQLLGPVRLVIAEGDSTDDTYAALKGQIDDRDNGDVLLKVDHHGPKFGSVDDPRRWRQIAMVANAVADHWDREPVVYVESDLIWEPGALFVLLVDLARVDAVAPMSMKDGRFYDIWGHRGLDGARFTMWEPYHEDLARHHDDLVEIGSAGSCVAMRPDVARRARFGTDDAMVGLGRSIRDGARLWLDQRVAVVHP